MNCNKELHDELKESGDIVCPFCDQKLEDSNEKPQDRLAKYYLCCDNQYIINDDGMLACLSCGIVQGYKSSVEYVNFYENRHKLKRKSVYHREYHINNILLDIEEKYNIEVSYHQKCKIDRVFTEIGNVITLYRQRFSLRKTHFLPLRRFLKCYGAKCHYTLLQKRFLTF